MTAPWSLFLDVTHCTSAKNDTDKYTTNIIIGTDLSRLEGLDGGRKLWCTIPASHELIMSLSSWTEYCQSVSVTLYQQNSNVKQHAIKRSMTSPHSTLSCTRITWNTARHSSKHENTDSIKTDCKLKCQTQWQHDNDNDHKEITQKSCRNVRCPHSEDDFIDWH